MELQSTNDYKLNERGLAHNRYSSLNNYQVAIQSLTSKTLYTTLDPILSSIMYEL